MKRLTQLGRCLFVALAVAACGGGLGDPTGSSCPSDSTLTYDTFGRTFFAENCSCHVSGTESPKLASAEAIRQYADDIDRAAAAGPDAVNTYMPEDRDLPESERRRLGEWLACGAP